MRPGEVLTYEIHGEQIGPEIGAAHRVTLTSDTVLQITALSPTAIPHDGWHDHVRSWFEVLSGPRYVAGPLARFRKAVRARMLRDARRTLDHTARRAESAWRFEA